MPYPIGYRVRHSQQALLGDVLDVGASLLVVLVEDVKP